MSDSNEPREQDRSLEDQSRPSVDPTSQLGDPATSQSSVPPVHVQPGVDYRPPNPAYPLTTPSQYPGYSAPYDQHPVATPSGTSGMAIASLVTSLVGLVSCGLTSIVGVVLGIVAFRETKRTGQKGRGMALAGAIIGGLVIVSALAAVVLFLVYSSDECGLVKHHTGCY